MPSTQIDKWYEAKGSGDHQCKFRIHRKLTSKTLIHTLKKCQPQLNVCYRGLPSFLLFSTNDRGTWVTANHILPTLYT